MIRTFFDKILKMRYLFKGKVPSRILWSVGALLILTLMVNVVTMSAVGESAFRVIQTAEMSTEDTEPTSDDSSASDSSSDDDSSFDMDSTDSETLNVAANESASGTEGAIQADASETANGTTGSTDSNSTAPAVNEANNTTTDNTATFEKDTDSAEGGATTNGAASSDDADVNAAQGNSSKSDSIADAASDDSGENSSENSGDDAAIVDEGSADAIDTIDSGSTTDATAASDTNTEEVTDTAEIIQDEVPEIVLDTPVTEQNLISRKCFVDIFKDATYSKYYTGNIGIEVEGMLPEAAIVKAYPVTASLEQDTVLCAFDISIYLPDGSLYEPASLIEVRFISEDFASLDDLDVYYFPENAAPVEMEANQSEETVSFTASHFSIYGVASTSTLPTVMMSTMNAIATTNYIGSYDTDNEWQIVAEQYAGDSNSNKLGRDLNGDGVNDLFIQKNVVPTDTENVFRVYLSATVQMDWEDILLGSNLLITTQNNWKSTPIGTIVNESDIRGNKSLIVPGTSGGNRTYTATINLIRNGVVVNTVTGIYSGTTPNASNCTGFILLSGAMSGKAILASTEVNLHSGGVGSGGTLVYNIDLAQMDNQHVYFSANPVELDTVTDQMGDYVTFGSVERSDGPANYDATTRTLTWYPDESVSGSSGEVVNDNGTITGYQYNLCQMVYTITLNVEQSGFNSSADNMNSTISDPESYKTNNYATLAYHSGTDISGTMNFQEPYVRGLLYNIVFNKVDENGDALEGARFGLFKADGTTLIQELTTTTEPSRFEDLPYGDYVLKELEAPDGYEFGDTTQWNIHVCYTDSPSAVEQDVDDPDNMRYIGNDQDGLDWRISNQSTAIKYKLQIVKVDRHSATPLEGAEFEVTDPENEDNTITLTTDENGIINFDPEFQADKSYTLTEVSAPAGYSKLVFDVGFTVSRDAENNNAPKVTLTGVDESAGFVTATLLPVDGSAKEYTLQMTVQNQSGNPLPLTGGRGIRFLGSIGLVVFGLALINKYVSARRRGRGDGLIH